MDKQINKERDRQGNRYIQWLQEFRILNNMKFEVAMRVATRLWLSLMQYLANGFFQNTVPIYQTTQHHISGKCKLKA
jgi:hypothetical protein